jgi:hypothetical protein
VKHPNRHRISVADFYMNDNLFPYKTKDYLQWGALIDLSDFERVWRAVSKDIRTSVRKGEKMGVRIRPFTAADLETVIGFTPNDDDIPPTFEDRHWAVIAEAEDTGEALGWILLAGVPGTKKMFMLCHASTLEGKRRQTPNILLTHAIKHWTGGPYRYLDVGVSYRASLQDYFQGYRQETYPMVMNPPALPIDLRITPFDTAAYGAPLGSPEEGRKILIEQFGTEEFTVFPRATFAIAAALREYRDQGRLTAEDEVLITTTTDTPYVSSHVTEAIEQVCKWSMTASEKTKIVFLIHEFGFPHPDTKKWRAFCDERNIPLIEDCAYGWGSEGVGSTGDVKIYSATKLLPVQFGGFLVGMKIPFDRMWHVHASFDGGKEEEILASVAAHWQPLDQIREQRQRIWQRYQEQLKSVIDPYFELPPNVMPYAFLAKMQDERVMKDVSAFVRRFGVEAGNWYHHAAVFLPCHQRMTERHADFVAGTVKANYREWCGLAKPGEAKH